MRRAMFFLAILASLANLASCAGPAASTPTGQDTGAGAQDVADAGADATGSDASSDAGPEPGDGAGDGGVDGSLDGVPDSGPDATPGDADAGGADVAIPCNNDKPCKALQQVCDKAAGVCVACNGPEDCDAGLVCSGHHCVPPPVACAATKDCPGLSICNKATGQCVECLVTNDCVSGQVCVDSACVTAPACTAGSKSCADGTTVATCKADGSGFDKAPCPQGQSCDGGVCKVAPDCPEVPMCQGNVAVSCQNGKVKQESCAVCLGGACCDPGVPMCEGEKVMQGWCGTMTVLVADCALTGQTCQGGQCVPKAVCTPGATGCSGSQVQTCKADGSGWSVAPCPGGQVCAGGSCKPQVCTAAAKACDGSKVTVCDATGTAWQASDDCAAKGQACQGGGCVAKAACDPGKYWLVNVGVPGQDKAAMGVVSQGLAGQPDAIYVAQETFDGYGYEAGHVMRLDADGKVQWNVTQAGAQVQYGSLTPWPAGGVAVAYAGSGFALLDGQGKSTMPPAGTYDGLTAIRPAQDGKLIVVGNVASAGAATIAKGVGPQLGWKVTFGSSFQGQPVALHDMIQLAGGDLVAAGTKTDLQLGPSAFVVRLQETSQINAVPVYQLLMGEPGQHIEAQVLRAQDDGGLLIAGIQWPGMVSNTPTAWTARVSGSGGKVWKSTTPLLKLYGAAATVRDAGGSFLWSAPSSDTSLVVLHVTDFARLVWSRTLAGSSGGGVAGVLSDGRVVVVSAQPNASGELDAIVRTLDPWGFDSCAAAGACGTLGWAACDDGNPCTIDGCDPATGCTHTPAGTNTPCGKTEVCLGTVCTL